MRIPTPPLRIVACLIFGIAAVASCGVWLLVIAAKKPGRHSLLDWDSYQR
jgi:hypothetical protein